MRAIAISLILSMGAASLAPGQSRPVPVDPFARSAPTATASPDKPVPAAKPVDAPRANPGELPRPYVTRQSDMEIPFSVRGGATAQTQPKTVRVFVSWDQGASWHFYDERRPEDGRFRFRPKQDGEFWFATQTIDRSGRSENAERRQPQLRLIVDTQRPQLLVQAQVQPDGEVTVSWTAADPTLVAPSLKLEYQDAENDSAPWQAVESSVNQPSAGTATGQARFRAAVAGRSIHLRAEIADAAGNAAYYSHRLSLAPPAEARSASGGGYRPPLDQTATHWPDSTRLPQTHHNQTMIATDDRTPANAGSGAPAAPNVVENPFLQGRLASSSQPQSSSRSSSPRNDASAAGAGAFTPAGTEELPAPGAEATDRYRPDDDGVLPLREGSAPALPAASSAAPPVETMPAPHSAYGSSEEIERSAPAPDAYGGSGYNAGSAPELSRPGESIDAPAGQRPRLTNSRRFSLEYDIDSVGPEGVAAVELWGTSDNGNTWVKWGTDPDRASPFDVEVNGEMTYGFRIVIVGRNGLATSTPQPGDAADIWVGIDATRPVARLTGAAYGQGEAAGKLDIRWEAADANLSARPVTLLIGDRPDGPFAPIAAGLPNTGQYFWEFDPRSPRQIFLRLEVRDDAGNVAIDQLTEPIKVEGLEPKGRIRGFSPVSGGTGGGFSQP